MYGSGTWTTRPTWVSTSSAIARWSPSACAPAQSPATPSWTVAGVFGIARSTGTPSERCFSIWAVGIAAATERTVCSAVRRLPTSPSRTSKSCGLTAMTTKPAPETASVFESVVSTPYRSASSSIRSCRRPVTTISSGFRQPELSSPASRDSPILPPPRMAIRLPSTAMRRSLGRVPRFDALAPDLRLRQLQGHETAAGAGHQVHAREAGPLLVAPEDARGVLGLDPAALDRRADLQQPEVADDAAVEAPEALRPDDADGVRADPALLLEPRRGCLGREPAQPLGVESPADADESRRLARGEPVTIELCRREAREVLGQRRRLELADRLRRVANEAPLDRARLA